MNEILIVGAGLSGATIAEHYARDSVKVVVVDKRDHIGGNVYDEIDKDTNIRVSRYGAHIFHTNDKGVWDYVAAFAKWRRWDHCVVADISGMHVPIPVNITTVNTLYGESLETENEMKEWIENERIVFARPRNSEEVALSRVGLRLYEELFAPYTFKQWAKTAKELDPSVLQRIPIRTGFDDRYFSDKYQGLPENGYTDLVTNMLKHPNITVRLGAAWEDVKDISWNKIIFTGPIDTYFESSGLPRLEYRSIKFHWERMRNSGYYQQNSVVNYPSATIPYTRCIEYKHFLNQKSSWTIIAKETTCDDGEPYYPVPTQKNQDLYKEYAKLAEKEDGVHFIGRLASYKYFNMDQAIRNAMDYYEKYLKV